MAQDRHPPFSCIIRFEPFTTIPIANWAVSHSLLIVLESQDGFFPALPSKRILREDGDRIHDGDAAKWEVGAERDASKFDARYRGDAENAWGLTVDDLHQ